MARTLPNTVSLVLEVAALWTGLDVGARVGAGQAQVVTLGTQLMETEDTGQTSGGKREDRSLLGGGGGGRLWTTTKSYSNDKEHDFSLLLS